MDRVAIPGFPGYEICPDGSVWKGAVRLCESRWRGKARVQLKRGGRNTSRLISGLLTAAFGTADVSDPPRVSAADLARFHSEEL